MPKCWIPADNANVLHRAGLVLIEKKQTAVRGRSRRRVALIRPLRDFPSYPFPLWLWSAPLRDLRLIQLLARERVDSFTNKFCMALVQDQSALNTLYKRLLNGGAVVRLEADDRQVNPHKGIHIRYSLTPLGSLIFKTFASVPWLTR